jgi:putative hemolysin
VSALNIFGVVFLIAVNAFFAATEFSLVAVRLSRVRQLVQQGDPRARIVEQLLGDLSRVVSGVQVGLTIANLALGYLGEITLAAILHALFSKLPHPWAAILTHAVALVIVFGILTVFQVVFGELVPKSVSLARAERVALLVALPFHWFLKTFSWAIDLLDKFAARVVGAFGIVSPHSHTLVRSTEELQVTIQQARDLGLLAAGEARFIQNATELGQVHARELMVPRPDMDVLSADASLDDTLKMFATTQRSRIPVYEGSLDHVLGFVHIKDLIWILLDRSTRGGDALTPREFRLKDHLHEILIVPDTKPASELLLEFLSRRKSLAVIVDEFGSILGLVALEDILEQMVGQIHDEFDVVERPVILPGGEIIFDAAIKIRDLEAQYHISLPDNPAYETVAGYILDRLGTIPRGGESFDADGYRFTVLEIDGRRVSRVKIERLKASPAPPQSVATPVASLIAPAARPPVEQPSAAAVADKSHPVRERRH